jgi:hypothetical protein
MTLENASRLAIQLPLKFNMPGSLADGSMMVRVELPTNRRSGVE